MWYSVPQWNTSSATQQELLSAMAAQVHIKYLKDSSDECVREPTLAVRHLGF